MSESMRIQQRLDAARNCEIQNSILRARQLYGSVCQDAGTCAPRPSSLGFFTPLESDLLEKRTACFTYISSNPTPVPESIRIQDKIQCTLDQATNPFNADTRFSIYRGPFIPPVCPPIPTEVLNANIPKQSLSRCPLGNKPTLPTLPA